ncbi:MAG: CPBP family glutamic-type intramembrane protease [Crenarchaeota archaeon]|nr:CPBP family glutamic-type intramembrane protease [Thermoproteota archaeon]MCR8454459.1 CPBP family glutamic-type intramembrane protease [Thermoproteota archaeon]MCR8463517.1 CPBP family glutamic-type intramembrane protease [Thermoproteota archaeon]MCR8471199.1 CPBP family glutamic-type intramembrane protease [Thermoproteota archaeon]MCR8471993.1 CPBP family glutamic-type intramembrane protease [Thermoproteota archaeon]
MLSETLFFSIYFISTCAILFDILINKTGKWFFLGRYDLTIPYTLSSILLALRLFGLIDYPYFVLLVIIIPAVAPVAVGIYIIITIKLHVKRARNSSRKLVLRISKIAFIVMSLTYTIASVSILELVSIENCARYFISIKLSVLTYLPFYLILIGILVFINYKTITHYYAFRVKTDRWSSLASHREQLFIIFSLPIFEEIIYRLVFYHIFGFTLNGIGLSTISFLMAHVYKLHLKKPSISIIRALLMLNIVVLSVINYMLLHFSQNILLPIIVHLVYNTATLMVIGLQHMS